MDEHEQIEGPQIEVPSATLGASSAGAGKVVFRVRRLIDDQTVAFEDCSITAEVLEKLNEAMRRSYE